VTPSPGDALLYAVSARRNMAWSSFKAAVDAIHPPGGKAAEEMRYVRSGAADVGDSLGHWDIVPDQQNATRICAAPAVLARLPWPGLPRAVLCGSRSPDTVSEVLAAGARQGKATVRATRQSARHPYAPARVDVVAGTDDGLAALVGDLGIRVAIEPPAWGLAQACCTVSAYLASLDWQPDDGLDWPRRDFDPGRLAFGPPRASRDREALRLSTYAHPRGWWHIDRLHREGQVASADRSWGRYAVLASAGIDVLRYDHRNGTVTVPRQVPLPKLAARSFALCSGQPPAVVPGEGLGNHSYTGVPQCVVQALAARLGQHVGLVPVA